MRRLATADASGGGLGSQADEFACTVVRCEGEGPELRVTQEVSRAWRGGRGQDLTDIVDTIADLLRRRGLDEIRGDAYAGQWVQQAFAAVGIRYRVAMLGQAEGTPKRLTKSRAGSRGRYTTGGTEAANRIGRPAPVCPGSTTDGDGH